MTNKIKHICATCKSDDVVLDAWAEWDVMIQDWVLRSVFDDAFCCSCEQACDLEEIDIEDEPVSMDIIEDKDEDDGPVFTLATSESQPEDVLGYLYRIEDDNPDRPVKYVHKFLDDIDADNPELKRAIELLSKNVRVLTDKDRE